MQSLAMLDHRVSFHAVAVKKGAVKQLLACCQAAAGRDTQQRELVAPAACVLMLVLELDAARDEFAEQSGAHILRLLLEKSGGDPLTQDGCSGMRPLLRLREISRGM